MSPRPRLKRKEDGHNLETEVQCHLILEEVNVSKEAVMFLQGDMGNL